MKRTGNIRPERRYHERRDEEERRTVPTVDSTKKILVTGDRNWVDVKTIVNVLQEYPSGTILVHGACKGVDIICAAVGEALGFMVHAYPADWDKFGRGAGPIRNQQMIDAEHRLDEPINVCIAFHDSIQDSNGTADMLDRTVKAEIPWMLRTSVVE